MMENKCIGGKNTTPPSAGPRVNFIGTRAGTERSGGGALRTLAVNF